VPLPTLDDGTSTLSIPRASHQLHLGPLLALPSNLDERTLLANVDMMQEDSWVPGGQLKTPKTISRFSHHRESSLSSLGSAGPASPFSQNTSNPHIAVTDSVGDAYHGLPIYEDCSNYQLAKSFSAPGNDTFSANYPHFIVPDAAAANPHYPGMSPTRKQRKDRGLLPPDFSTGSHRSQPVSVASSTSTCDSPATPLSEPDGRRKSGLNTMPKLEGTMTDIYGDEFYGPNFVLTTPVVSHPGHVPVSPSNDVFARRLHAANSQHLSAAHSPVSTSSRDRSPFCHGSPHAPAPTHDFPPAMPSHVSFRPAQQLREQSKAEHHHARALEQQLRQAADHTAAPQTISPKDAVLEFQEPEGEVDFPLFPRQNSDGFADQMSKAVAAAQDRQSYDGFHLEGNFGFATAQLSAGIQVPQQYPFIAQPRQQQTSIALNTNGSLGQSTAGPAEPVTSDAGRSTAAHKPASGTGADGGTYTCTYHGCTLRFETPALLQKHKREGHRQAHGLTAARNINSTGMATSLLNSQAGPHRCDRVNPGTGKPCNTVFSRPYDLTRHEDTIHNARKQKVRCNLCTDEKTFSRADALTRHYRVCHPEVEFPGKHRRRGHQSG
jgi:hypothetical protein